uniref:Serine/threonine-protein phosphatase 4 regulatory subunit 2 n=1 Tax=Esox lucius TaxID=8010 RepID=A0A6Q2WUU8_ESOLU
MYMLRSETDPPVCRPLPTGSDLTSAILKCFFFPLLFCVENATTNSLPLGSKRLTEEYNMMEIDSLQEALKEFDKKGKKEVAPLLDQFLGHVAKTGETMVQWSQFKSYFLFKLEKVMDDFKASAPDQRGVANPNVESIPFEEMKERILKIVNGYNGIPFTIQRLCELLTEPKRNYTGTEKFLRGVEKNVMVVSCVHPTSEKNGCSGVNRMNGVMLPGNSSAFTERKVNGPGTPRPLNRPKLSLASSLATNGLPDSTENKDPVTEQGHSKPSSEVSASGSPGNSVKNKHHDDEEEDMEAEQHEVKRLKFNKEDEEEDQEEQEADTLRPSHTDSLSEEAESMVQEKDQVHEGDEEDREATSSAGTCEDQAFVLVKSEIKTNHVSSCSPLRSCNQQYLSEKPMDHWLTCCSVPISRTINPNGSQVAVVKYLPGKIKVTFSFSRGSD